MPPPEQLPRRKAHRHYKTHPATVSFLPLVLTLVLVLTPVLVLPLVLIKMPIIIKTTLT